MKIILFSILIISNLFGKNYYLGQTWEFAEKDLLSEIKMHIKTNEKKINSTLKKYSKEMKKKVENISNDFYLPQCKKDDIWYNDMRYKNPFNTKHIPKGVWIYPLKTLTYHNELIIFNANEKKEMKYIKSLDYRAMDKRYLMSQGKLKDVVDELGISNVYFLQRRFQERVKLRCTPSIVNQVGDQFQIREIGVKNK